MNDGSQRGGLLRKALIANALFSGFSAVTCSVAAPALARTLGLEASLLRSLGVELLVFAGFLTFLATRPTLARGWPRVAVPVVIALDALWVVGSVVALSGQVSLTTTGWWVVAAVATVVADVAALQLVGWWRLRSPTDPTPRHPRRQPVTDVQG